MSLDRLRPLGDRLRPLRERLRPLGDRLAQVPPPRLAGFAAIVLVLAATAVGLLVGGERDERDSIPQAGRQSNEERRTSFLARIIPAGEEAPRKPPAGGVPKSAIELAKRLPTERKVAQLFLVGFDGRDLTAPIFRQLRRLDLGGIVIGSQNYTDPAQLASLAGEARVIARQAEHLPPWVMATQEGGEFSSFRDLPPARAAADLETTEQAVTQARATARALKPLDINGLLGPVIDTGVEQELAVGARAFSDDPDLVASYASALVSTYREERLFAAVKHFPGLGSGSQPTSQGPSNVGLSLAELGERDLLPFRTARRAGVPGMVLSSALYAPDDFVTPGSLSKSITTDLLRKRIEFKGVAITDDLADPAITALGTVPDAAVQALKAGADMLQISGSAGTQQAAYVAVLAAVRSKEIPPKRLNQAVARVLSAKEDYGLIK